MQTKRLIYLPQALVEFSKEELLILFIASRAHYDLWCRKQSDPGGLLWDMRNRQDSETDTLLDSSQVDLLAKIAERLVQAPVAKGIFLQDAALCLRVQSQLGEILANLNAEYRRLNP
jgi:hypothetical protein